MKLWDYKLKKGWKPQNDFEWCWYLERKINYDDWRGLKRVDIQKYYKQLNLDPGKKLMITAYFKKYDKKKLFCTWNKTRNNSSDDRKIRTLQ